MEEFIIYNFLTPFYGHPLSCLTEEAEVRQGFCCQQCVRVKKAFLECVSSPETLIGLQPATVCGLFPEDLGAVKLWVHAKSLLHRAPSCVVFVHG